MICQIGGHEAIALGLVSPEAPPVACTICQGTYDPDAPGTIAFTIHTDCGNGCAPPSDACDMARGHPPPSYPLTILPQMPTQLPCSQDLHGLR